MSKAWFEPCGTLTAPVGEIEPFTPAVAVIVYTFRANVALMAWFAFTAGKLYEEVGGVKGDVSIVVVTPSTVIDATWYPGFAVMLKAWLEPCGTLTAPAGEIEPFAPAVAVIV